MNVDKVVDALKLTVWDTRLGQVVRRWREDAQAGKWIRSGRPIPPPHIVKQQVLRHHRERFGLSTLIETGTYQGDMIHAMRDAFSRIYSIELDERLYRRALKRFKGMPHVTILQGDSGVVLKRVLSEETEPCLLWLDGHYSGSGTARGDLDTPIEAELRAVLRDRNKRHVILVDDARLFNGIDGYPTVKEIEALVAAERPDCIVEVADDVIRICPSRS